MNEIIAFVFSLLMNLPGAKMCLADGPTPPSQGCIKENIETKADREVRYMDIANAVVDSVYGDTLSENPTPKHILGFYGDRKLEASLSMVLAISYMESGFRKDVDLGIGKGRGDHGNSCCVMQILVGKNQTAEGWTCDDLVSDRRKCFTSGYRIVRQSFGGCYNLPLEYRLTQYASGQCGLGKPESKARVSLGLSWFAKTPNVKDETIINFYKQKKVDIEIVSNEGSDNNIATF